ncbi:MAG: response regulator [Hyphomicrobiaceae bacterium]
MPASRPRPLVVVIENDSRLADAVGLLLHDWGFAAVLAKSAGTAARILGVRIKDVSAVIADYHLDDGFTGIGSAAALGTAIGRSVPTIVTTGFPVLAEHRNVFPVLAKPFDPGLLHRWLEDHVDRRPATAAA